MEAKGRPTASWSGRLALAGAAVIVAGLGIYASLSAETGPASDLLQAEAKVREGLTGAMTLEIHPEPRPLPAPVGFVTADGTASELSAYRGGWVLVNLWATWCAPCIKEMPSLHRLQQAMGGQDFRVVPIALEMGRLEGAKAFLADNGLDLPLLWDKGLKLPKLFGIKGIPATFLIDPEGREVMRLVGHTEWDSAPVTRLLRGLMGGNAAPAG